MIILAGGQTGVDQAAHRAAVDNYILCAGWCPPDWSCEDGSIPALIPVMPTPEDRSEAAASVPRSQRTEWNVRDADGTLILSRPGNPEDPGTAWAAQVALNLGVPLLQVNPLGEESIVVVQNWLAEHRIRVLNVAGPSESTWAGVSEIAYDFLFRVFQEYRED
jgi:hypothetical protein